MTYSNLPLYVGYANTNDINLSTQTGLHPLSAMNVSIDYPTKINSQKMIGAGSRYTYGGPLEVKIDFDFLLNTRIGDFTPYVNYNFLRTNYNPTYLNSINNSGANYFPIKIGGNLFKKCFIDSYEFSIQPFQPVIGKASFTCYEPPFNEKISGASPPNVLNNNLSSEYIIHGNDVQVSGFNQAVSDKVLSSINYKIQYARTPVYTLGSIYPSRHLIDSIDAEMQIESTGLNSLINHSGQQLSSDIKISLQDQSGRFLGPTGFGSNVFPETQYITMPSGSILYNEKYSAQGGDSLMTSCTIRNVIV